MFEYGPMAAEASGGEARPPLPAGGARARALAAVDLAKRHKALVLSCALACALIGFAASKLLTPRYVAVTQIYVDPGNLPGAGRDLPAPGQDSNGFINYVESQSLIVTSRAVLERVVADEKLDADPDFSGAWRLPAFVGSSPGAADRTAAATAALATRIQVKRPERTFIIDLSVSDRDPLRAAELANATARAYIDVSSAWQADVSRRTEVSLAGRLEALRQRVVDAEKKVEDFKAANGLVGTRDSLVSEQQLKDMNAQMMNARAKAAEARARLDQIENAHRRGGDVAALASEITSASLAALRTQQGLARQRLADLTAELGPRHPQVIDAKARVEAADAAVEAELTRFAQSQRIEYDSAKQLEAALSGQLDRLKAQSNANGQSSVGLRDLEREADAARGVYELFVTRSREAGEIQQVEPSRTRIVSLATAPKSRAFPPSGALMASLGLLLGLGLGAAGSLARERRAAAGRSGRGGGARGERRAGEAYGDFRHYRALAARGGAARAVARPAGPRRARLPDVAGRGRRRRIRGDPRCARTGRARAPRLATGSRIRGRRPEQRRASHGAGDQSGAVRGAARHPCRFDRRGRGQRQAHARHPTRRADADPQPGRVLSRRQSSPARFAQGV